MYDTTNGKLPVELINDCGYFKRVPTLLQNCKELYNHETCETSFTGKFGNLNFNVSKSGVAFNGSICKLYLGNNVETMTRQDTQRAFEYLEEELSLPLRNSKLSRIDFSNNLDVTHLPQTYYTLLGNSKGLKRLIQPASLQYVNGSKTLLFYNKVAECKDKRQVIPEVWTNKNILRYELRYTKRLPKHFNTDSVKVSDLYNEEFYMAMVDRWHNEYEKITKNGIIIDDMDLENLKTPKDYFYQLALMMIKEKGLQSTLDGVDQLKAISHFDRPEYYSRLKRDIRNLCTDEKTSSKSPLILELDKKIRQVKEHYR